MVPRVRVPFVRVFVVSYLFQDKNAFVQYDAICIEAHSY